MTKVGAARLSHASVEHLCDIGVVHERESLSFGLEEDSVTPAIVYVDADSTYDPTTPDAGTSWATAFADLQDVIDLANTLAADADPETEVSEIWVAEGIYVPTELSDANGDGTIDTDPRSVTFMLVDGVSIYGGFEGTETTIGDRASNPDGSLVNVTILSGDLNGDDEAGIDVADLLTHASREDNGRRKPLPSLLGGSSHARVARG